MALFLNQGTRDLEPHWKLVVESGLSVIQVQAYHWKPGDPVLVERTWTAATLRTDSAHATACLQWQSIPSVLMGVRRILYRKIDKRNSSTLCHVYNDIEREKAKATLYGYFDTLLPFTLVSRSPSGSRLHAKNSKAECMRWEWFQFDNSVIDRGVKTEPCPNRYRRIIAAVSVSVMIWRKPISTPPQCRRAHEMTEKWIAYLSNHTHIPHNNKMPEYNIVVFGGKCSWCITQLDER